MIISATPVAGAFLIEPDRHADQRGYFARIFGRREFLERGLAVEFAHTSVSFNTRRGTLRGLHLQEPPHAEVKLVRCTRGAAWDVALDLRPESPSYLRHFGTQLSADNGHALYIPEGCAHGFLTLEDTTEIAYQISADYAPAAGRGVRFDDPAFGIVWTEPVVVIAERDAKYPDYRRPE